MNAYFSAITFINTCALLIMLVLVWENARLSKEIKNSFYHLFIVVLVGNLFDWGAVLLNGGPTSTIFLHKVVKGLNYIFIPMQAYFFIAYLAKSSKIIKRFTSSLLIFNTLFNITSIFTGWNFYVDNNNIYHHGSFYLIYVAVYVMIMFIIVHSFIKFSKDYNYRNKLSLFGSLIVIISGIVIQQVIDSSLRVIPLGLTYGVILLFIHSSEFYQLDNDEKIEEQDKLINADALTGLYSQYPYFRLIKKLNTAKKIHKDVIVFSIDVNGLKYTNDTLGHQAGDELIKGAAQCIKSTLGKYGKCYRVGGDEFVAIINASKNKLKSIVKELKDFEKQWCSKEIDSIHFAVGYALACENPECNLEELLNISDGKMYKDKSSFYRKNKKYNVRKEK